MILWGWYRARRWGWKLLLGFLAVSFAAVALYVAGRSLQFAAAERDPALYIPSAAHVVLRARNLQAHWSRIQQAPAWRTIRRRVLKDPAFRRMANDVLKANGLPTIDDLEDERKAGASAEAMLLRAAGRDAAVALQVPGTWDGARWCAATNVRWSDYLLLPMLPWVIPTEKVGEQSCLRVGSGKMDVFVAFAGRLAIASNDRAFLGQALQRKGRAPAGDRPIEVRMEVAGSAALLALRRDLKSSGLLPHIAFDRARALEVAANVDGSAISLEASIEGADAAHPGLAPPNAFARLAPATSTGVLVTQAGAQDIWVWLKSLVRPGARDLVSTNVQQAFNELERGKFSEDFLPCVEPGMAVVIGSEPRGGRVYPTMALLFPTKNPRGAVEAMSQLIKTIAGTSAEAFFEKQPVEDVEMFTWRWPESLQINDFLRPCYAGLKDVFVLGNNVAFTEAVINAAAGGGGEFDSQRSYRALQKDLKKYGFSADHGLAGGFVLLPLLHESMDGPIPRLAVFFEEASMPGPQLRAQIEGDLRKQGRKASGPEIDQMFNEARQRRQRDQEAALRGSLRVLDALKWAAFTSGATPRGVSLRLVLEFR